MSYRFTPARGRASVLPWNGSLPQSLGLSPRSVHSPDVFEFLGRIEQTLELVGVDDRGEVLDRGG